MDRETAKPLATVHREAPSAWFLELQSTGMHRSVHREAPSVHGDGPCSKSVACSQSRIRQEHGNGYLTQLENAPNGRWQDFWRARVSNAG